ncbi:MAG: ABC transporter ATP-binding protein [candidate division NC10 bacterium]|nr:ABC transporter ATP-binding protein [candidate division NC10 bacterium]
MSARGSGTAIRLADCSKTFPNGTRALERITLGMRGGETVVFLGPSGCGKTTLLRVIAGLESPDPGGRVFFDDEDVTVLPIERRNVGMVFQSYALFPNMNVEENIAYGLKIHGAPQAQRAKRVDEMLQMMQIGELRERRITQLSGGQRQRVALARAIAVQPRVLLLDEPLTALDALLRERLRIEIDVLLHSLGITAAYVTHDQGEAMAIGDRVAVVDRGAIVQVGTPREIYYKPANAFVADFIGTMNRVRGTVRDGFLELPGGRIPWIQCGEGTVEVLFRPNDARIMPPGEAALRGEVVQQFFLGDRTRLHVAGVADRMVVVETTEHREFKVAERIGLLIEPDTLLRLKD